MFICLFSTPQRSSNKNLDEGICSIDNISPYHNKCVSILMTFFFPCENKFWHLHIVF